MQKPLNRYSREITGILLVKLLLIILIKTIWFSDKPVLTEQNVAAQFLTPGDPGKQQRKPHD